MHWGNYKAVWFFTLFILFLFFYIFDRKRIKKIISRFPYIDKMFYLNKKLYALRFFLILSALLFGILALMRPQWGIKEKNLNLKGYDIIFAIDTSKSMLARDIKPDRLTMAKIAVSKFIDSLSGSRIGVIAFAGRSKVIVPLTYDYSYTKYSVMQLNTDTIGYGGTNFKDLLEKTTLIFSKSDRDRFLILLTDGEDHAGNIESAIKYAKDGNIRIYTIGVGTEKGARIPIIKNGGVAGFKMDRNGNFVITKINPSILKMIAGKTGGQFFYGTDIYAALHKIYNNISSFKKKNSGTVHLVKYKERYQIFLFISFLLLFVAFLLPIGKINRKSIFLLFISFFFLQGFTFLDNGAIKNKKGVNKYEKRKYMEALDAFQEAKKYSSDKKLDYNIGTALYKLGKYDDAIKYFERSSKENAKDAFYNIGNSYFMKKRYKKAIEYYKMALKEDHDFLKAKKNLELALKKLKENKNNNKKNNNKNSKKSDKNNKNKKNNKHKNKNNKKENRKDSKNKKNEKRKNDEKKKNKSVNLKKKMLKSLLDNLTKQELKKKNDFMKKGGHVYGKSMEKDW